jgi:hypothetical protein
MTGLAIQRSGLRARCLSKRGAHATHGDRQPTRDTLLSGSFQPCCADHAPQSAAGQSVGRTRPGLTMATDEAVTMAIPELSLTASPCRLAGGVSMPQSNN